MNARWGARIGAMLVVILSAACGSAPRHPPAPVMAQAAAITIKIHLRLPTLKFSDGDDVATTVYFVKACTQPGTPCEERLIPSNHERNGRVYLLNAEPGEYRPVAASFESVRTVLLVTSRGVAITYLPDSLAREASVEVQPGRLVDAGQHLIHATYGVCRDTADPGQVRVAELMDPGTEKCGLVDVAVDALLHIYRLMKPEVVIGGKTYPAGTSAHHYRGLSHEALPDASNADSLEAARKDLEAAGWHFEAEPPGSRP